MVSEDEPDDNERLAALGLLTVRSAKLEADLRGAFCALVGSRYAVVVAGGQAVSWLIDQCQALVKANLEMTEEQKAAVKAALDECRIANDQRNTLVHGLKIDSKAVVVTARSRRGTFEPLYQSWTDETIRGAASRLSAARAALRNALRDGVPHALAEEYVLRQLTDAFRDDPALRKKWDAGHADIRRSRPE